jgi:uncharacterized protein YifN (PemK superfamily)
MNILEKFGIIPIDYSTIVSVLPSYKSPKDKIAALEKSGEIIRLKKGLFVVAPMFHHLPISKELIANHLYGPSYISLETALSIYGMIPERVYSIRSISAKRTKQLHTKLGLFDYVYVSEAYYHIGLRQNIVNKKYAYLIASPEKALCDLIVTTARLRLQSVKAIQIYLEEDLRLDFSLNDFDTEIVRQCIDAGRNKIELRNLLKFLEQ